MDVVYFELNNWFAGRDYPDAEPFTTWCGNDMNLYFNNEDFVKKNKLVVVQSLVDMSTNWCITAPKSFVEENCPELLGSGVTTTKFIVGVAGKEKEEVKTYPYSNFLRFPDQWGDVTGRFGCPFLEWSEENVGITYWDEED